LTDVAAKPRKRSKGLLIAVAGLVVVLASPWLWALTLDVPVLARTALAMWVGMALGVAVAVYAAWGDSRWRTRGVAAAAIGLVVLVVPAFVVFTRLPAAQLSAGVARVVDVPLEDDRGRTRTLGALLDEQAVLLVFYRGYW
jgi:hypothetical protein